MLWASVAGTRHTQVGGSVDGLLHVGADAAHLLAAGAWLGGLIALVFLLRERPPASAGILTRFSGMGYVAVSVLILTGLVNSWFFGWVHIRIDHHSLRATSPGEVVSIRWNVGLGHSQSLRA